MAEATMDPSEVAALQSAAREFDRAGIIKLGSYHFAMVMGALTMWGAAETWAQATGWGIAQFAAVANAIVAAFVIASTIHEWGHFTGARLSGAVSPVLDEAKGHFFMFNFPFDQNDTRQFTWMSWGGILAPWIAVILAWTLVPLGLLGGKVLVAALVMKAVAAGTFEVPIVLAAAKSGEPAAELGKSVAAGTLPQSRKVGLAVGVALFVLLWIAV